MGTPFATQTSCSVLDGMDTRRHRRYAVDSGILRVFWLNARGEVKRTRTRARTISESGIAIELPDDALPSSMVRFQSEQFAIKGAGAVRHCEREGTKWIVGLEFIEGLRWTPPQGEV